MRFSFDETIDFCWKWDINFIKLYVERKFTKNIVLIFMYRYSTLLHEKERTNACEI